MINNTHAISEINDALKNLYNSYAAQKATLIRQRKKLMNENEACTFCRGDGVLRDYEVGGTKHCTYCDGTGSNAAWRAREIKAFGR